MWVILSFNKDTILRLFNTTLFSFLVMPFILVILVEVFVEWVGPQKVSASNMVGSSLKNLGPYPILYTLPQLLCEDEKKIVD